MGVGCTDHDVNAYVAKKAQSASAVLEERNITFVESTFIKMNCLNDRFSYQNYSCLYIAKIKAKKNSIEHGLNYDLQIGS